MPHHPEGQKGTPEGRCRQAEDRMTLLLLFTEAPAVLYLIAIPCDTILVSIWLLTRCAA